MMSMEQTHHTCIVTKTKCSSGFTLIELLIVITIIAVLLAIAVPSYRQYQVQAARAEAKAVLLDAASYMQRWFNSNNTFITTTGTLPTNLQFSPTSTNASGAKYLITLSAVTATTFTLSAAPNNANGFYDPLCGTLTVNQLGTKALVGAGAGGTIASCWAR